MRQRLVLPLLGASILVLWAPPGFSQIWEGRGELELRVRAESGGPVSGAEVTLEFLGSQRAGGPDSVRTDSSGRAAVSGLAEGVWRLEVSHPEFLTYVARVDLTLGKKVDELQVAQRSDGGGTGLLRVKFDKVRRGDAPPPSRATPTPRPLPEPETEPTRPPAAEPAEPAPPSAPAESAEIAGETAPDEAARDAEPSPAPATESPTVPPERGETPPPEDDTSEGPVSGPAADDEAPPPPVRPDASEPATPDATAPPDLPETAAVPADPRPSATEMPPATPPSARPLARVRSADDGSCPDCRPGELGLSADVTVAPGPGLAACPADPGASIERAFRELVEAVGRQLGEFHGPLVDPGLRDLVSLAPPEVRRSALETLGDLASETSSCRLVAILLPIDTQLGGFRYEARDVDRVADCLPSEECPLAGARWSGNPGRLEAGGRTLVWALFSNASPDRQRHGRLTVYLR